MTCKEGELYCKVTSWPDEEDVGSSDRNHHDSLCHFFLQAAFSWWLQADLSPPLRTRRDWHWSQKTEVNFVVCTRGTRTEVGPLLLSAHSHFWRAEWSRRLTCPSPLRCTRDCPGLEESGDLLSTVKLFLHLGLPTSLEEDLLLSSSQSCRFLSCPSSCCGLAAVVLLSHHFSGCILMALFLLLLFSEYYCDQTSTEILDPGHWCLQSAVRQCCSELSLSLHRLQTETYQSCITMQATSTKFSGFHIKCCVENTAKLLK